jgi:hypothetical protein
MKARLYDLSPLKTIASISRPEDYSAFYVREGKLGVGFYSYKGEVTAFLWLNAELEGSEDFEGKIIPLGHRVLRALSSSIQPELSFAEKSIGIKDAGRKLRFPYSGDEPINLQSEIDEAATLLFKIGKAKILSSVIKMVSSFANGSQNQIFGSVVLDTTQDFLKIYATDGSGFCNFDMKAIKAEDAFPSSLTTPIVSPSSTLLKRASKLFSHSSKVNTSIKPPVGQHMRDSLPDKYHEPVPRLP